MFEFGDDLYQWCHSCSGNVRRDAYVCRYCKTAIGSKLLKNKKAKSVGHLIDLVAKWTPHWDDTFDALPDALKRRILVADAETPAPHIGIDPSLTPDEARAKERNNLIGSADPPEAAVLGLVWDILLGIHEIDEEKAREICASPRLQQLELNMGEIKAEDELRRKECSEGTPCRYCSELILADDACRFCGGSSDQRPKPVDFINRMYFQRLDPELLRRTILFEAAARRLHQDGERIGSEILEANSIDDSSIEAEMLAQRNDPKRLPYSRWRERFIQLKLESYCQADWFAMHDLQNTANGAGTQKRYTEALIVFDHIRTRWKDNPQFKEMQFSIDESLASVYMQMGNYEKYHEVKKSAREHLPEQYRDLLADSDKTLERTFTRPDVDENKDEDPLVRFEKTQEMFDDMQKRALEAAERMDAIMPGFGDMMKEMQKNIMSRTIDVTRAIAEGQSAVKKGNYDEAIEKFEGAMKSIGDDDSGLSGLRKAALMCDIAEALQDKGDVKEAEQLFFDSIQLGKDLLEVDSTGHEVASSTFRYAVFLKETERLDEAKSRFEEAHELQLASIERQTSKYNLKPESMAGTLAKEREQYADLLKEMGLLEEEKKIREEIVELKKQEEAHNARRRQNHRAFLEGLPGVE